MHFQFTVEQDDFFKCYSFNQAYIFKNLFKPQKTNQNKIKFPD